MRESHKNTHPICSLFEQLEERVLFDGVPDATFVIPATDAGEPIPAQVQNAESAYAENPRELILIDAGVENAEQLLSEILESQSGSSLEIRFLDSNENGINQITQILNESDQKYSAIHILSHGEEGEVSLGNAVLSNETLGLYSDQLVSWANALTDDADLLFYGCDLAGNQDGKSLIESVSAVTGADVAASEDLTGDAAQGGDWSLEFVQGQVEATTLSAENWSGTLAVEASDGAVSIEDAENSAAGTITLTNNGAPEVLTSAA